MARHRVSTERKDIRHLSDSTLPHKASYDLVLSSYALNESWEGKIKTAVLKSYLIG